MLRELTIEMHAKGFDPQQELKIHNFAILWVSAINRSKLKNMPSFNQS
jgi:hypothetical protein